MNSMPKLKTVYVCSSCETQHPKWAGQCDNCGEWNTLLEDVVEKNPSKIQEAPAFSLRSTSVRKISELDHTPLLRFKTGIGEFDRVLGGGIVPGSVMLLGGEPGIGKSTISLQVLGNLSKDKNFKNIAYIAGEESTHQIALRAKRLKVKLENVSFIETNILEEALKEIEKLESDFIVLDSIQVIKSQQSNSLAGGVTQIRQVAEKIINFAKSKNIPCLIIGHVTKDGEIAGPKVLEHLVDTVLYIQGDKINTYRFIKSIKNRFGATDEVGIFRMEEAGLIEIPDPATEFVKDREETILGSALTCAMEGNRPFIIEVQALTSASNFGYPKRSATGFDLNRLNMIVAVLQKYFGVNLSEQDVFVNVSGGFKIKDTACDIAVMKAIMSSYSKQMLKQDTVYIGEVSLTGKFKKVAYQKLREKEVKRLGFKVVKEV